MYSNYKQVPIDYFKQKVRFSYSLFKFLYNYAFTIIFGNSSGPVYKGFGRLLTCLNTYETVNSELKTFIWLFYVGSTQIGQKQVKILCVSSALKDFVLCLILSFLSPLVTTIKVASHTLISRDMIRPPCPKRVEIFMPPTGFVPRTYRYIMIPTRLPLFLSENHTIF